MAAVGLVVVGDARRRRRQALANAERLLRPDAPDPRAAPRPSTNSLRRATGTTGADRVGIHSVLQELRRRDKELAELHEPRLAQLVANRTDALERKL